MDGYAWPLIWFQLKSSDVSAILLGTLCQEDFISDSDDGEELLRGPSGLEGFQIHWESWDRNHETWSMIYDQLYDQLWKIMIIQSHPGFDACLFLLFPDTIGSWVGLDMMEFVPRHRGKGDKLWRSMWMGMRAPRQKLRFRCFQSIPFWGVECPISMAILWVSTDSMGCRGWSLEDMLWSTSWCQRTWPWICPRWQDRPWPAESLPTSSGW